MKVHYQYNSNLGTCNMIETAGDEDVTSWVYESLLIQPNKIPLYVTLQHSLSRSVPASSFQYDNVVSSSPSTEPEDWLLGTTSSHEPVVMNPELDILGHSQDIGHQTPTDRSDDNANSIPSSSQRSKPKNIQDYDNLNLASVNTSGDITVGQLYPSKKDLKLHLGMLVMRKNYEFKVKRSAKDRFEVVCVGKNCKWGLRATKLKDLTYFEVRKFQNEHSCSLDELHRDHRQASSALIGQYVKSKFEGQVSRIYRPKDIVDDVRVQLGVNMSYNKAWRAREAALEIARGSPEESFAILPSYCSMLERNNPGTVTHIETDADNHFLYFFMALGVSIRGFHSSMRPVIAIDGAFLKGKYFGTLLVAACQDGENQIYPLAFGVVDSENDASWSWFMTKLKGAIGNVKNLAFISDRHGSIAKALHSVFPEAHHGACIFHISGNLKHKFGNTTKMLALFFKAAKEYQVSEFNKLMEDIGKLKNGDIKKYLEEIGYYRWARAHFPGYRYGMMTSNIAESLNSKLKEARKLPITALVDHLREVSQQWFVERRSKGSSLSTHLTKWCNAPKIRVHKFILQSGFNRRELTFRSVMLTEKIFARFRRSH